MKEIIYVVTRWNENASKIQAKGFESASYIPNGQLLEHLREIAQICRDENKVALFEFK